MRSVFILEDEPLIALMIAELVEDLGCEVVGPALSLDRAFQIVGSGDIDFAVLDILIEGQSAYAVGEELERRGTPFLFTTGYDTTEIDGRFACPVIPKPFDPRHLQGVIANQLGLEVPRS